MHALYYMAHTIFMTIIIIAYENYLLSISIIMHSKQSSITCQRCGEKVLLNECFKDKAAENELKTTTVKCRNQECPWEGPGQFYKVSF